MSAAACSDDAGLVQVQAPEVQIDELKQKSSPKVDILWIVDNSGTMREEQEALDENFQRFINGLTLCNTGIANDTCRPDGVCSASGEICNPIDYHIGAISTDTSARNAATDSGQLRLAGVCSGPNTSDENPDYCRPGHADTDCRSAGASCDVALGLRYITPTTANARDAFGKLVQVGTDGNARETGFAAAALALGLGVDRATRSAVPMPAVNAGFIREDASLYLIFVSDEDDKSFGDVNYYYRQFEHLKGAGNENLVSVSAIVGTPDPDGSDPTSGGPLPGGCEPGEDESGPQADPGNRYVELAMYASGYSPEFRVCDESRVLCGTAQACHQPASALPGVCVSAAQCTEAADCGTTQCGDGPCFVCDAGACRVRDEALFPYLERSGVYGSLCGGDFGPVLSNLGFAAAGLARKFELTRLPNCTENVACCEGGGDDCGTEQPLCVRVTDSQGTRILPNSRDAGWILDPGTNSIFFDGSYVPPADATVAITYRAAEGAIATGCAQLFGNPDQQNVGSEGDE